MFDFFDNEKNPFMFIMNMKSAKDEADREEEPADAEFMQMMQQFYMTQMQMMQQTFMTQMQMMHMMWMMPLQFTQGFFKQMGMNTSAADRVKPEADASAGQQGGFKLGNMEIPPELLAWLMQMDMSPENLEKLQGFLDSVFEAIPQPEDECAVRQEENR